MYIMSLKDLIFDTFMLSLESYYNGIHSSQQNYLLLKCHPGSGGKLHCPCVRVINTVDLFA